MRIATPKIFAPTKDPCRGDLTPKYLFHRWSNYLREKRPNAHHKYQEKTLRNLANEFDRVGWDELKPYYLEFHDFEEARRTEFETVFLGIGYGNILRAGRIAEKYGRDGLNPEKLELFTDTFAHLTREGFKPSRFTFGFSSLVERGGSFEELEVCSRHASNLASELIIVQRLCQLHKNISSQFTLANDRARALNESIEETIQCEKDRRGFIGEGDDGEIDISSEKEEDNSGINLPMILDVALGAIKLFFR